MASEEPRPTHDTAEMGGEWFSSAAVECSAYSLQNEKGANVTTFSTQSDCAPGDKSRDQIMPSMESFTRTATPLQGGQPNSEASSPANEQNQNVVPKVEVKSEPASSPNTYLSSIPPQISSPYSSPETQSTDSFERLSMVPDHTKGAQESSLGNVREVARSTDLAETGAAIARATLNELKGHVIDAKQPDLLEKLECLRKKQVKPTKTVVAVVGATGAGKSSLINAVLCEEELLPTSGMTACTAVITEISYNHDEDPDLPYLAEIEFISSKEWESELSVVINDLVEGTRLNSAWSHEETEAGVAYIKLRCVYPNVRHERLNEIQPRQLMGDAAVRNVLGTTRRMAFKTAAELHSALKIYIGSKGNHQRSTSKNGETAAVLWPLIKVVRIYCRADALSTGLCIVDLPGIYDSNAARSAIAKRYMAECTAIWLASPIKRAVDDKAAKELLGQSSRTQLKMDGTYSNVTFICTCSDAFDVKEIQQELDHDGRIEEYQQRKAGLDGAIAEKSAEIRISKNQLAELESQYDVLDEEQQLWNGLSRQHERQQPVYAPAPATLDRPSKRQKRESRRMLIEETSIEEPPKKQALTGDEISKKLEDLTQQLNSKAAKCDEVEESLGTAKTSLEPLERESANLANEIPRLCVQLRNNWCKDEIRKDFAAGIREADEAADQMDDAAFDPATSSQRDYGEVGRHLPVFTISSSAHKKMNATGRQPREKVDGFINLEDTEIPALRAHAKGMTKTIQIREDQAFLNDFIHLLGRLQIVADSIHDEVLLSSQAEVAQEGNDEVEVLKKGIVGLKEQVNTHMHLVKASLLQKVKKGPQLKFSGAASFAFRTIGEVVEAWHAKEREPVGNYEGLGLPYATYKSTCKRHGAKTPSKKSRDFNEMLLDPFMTKISSTWEKTFAEIIPNALDEYCMMLMRHLQSFHDQVTGRPGWANTRNASLRMLEQQLPDHQAMVRDAVQVAKIAIQSDQRNASRLFYPEIQAQMKDLYEKCADQKGRGCFARMKTIMRQTTEKRKKTIYGRPHRAVTLKIEASLKSATSDLLEQIDRICEVMYKNYSTVVSCSQMIEADAAARQRLHEALVEIDAKFEAIIIASEQAKDIDSEKTPRLMSEMFVAQDAEEDDEMDM